MFPGLAMIGNLLFIIGGFKSNDWISD